MFFQPHDDVVSELDSQRRRRSLRCRIVAARFDFDALERRRCAVTYVRTSGGLEVDFPARGADGKAELIQVCADASDPVTAERKLRALMQAEETHPRARKRLLTLTRDSAPADSPPGVIVQPAYEWILAGAEHGRTKLADTSS